MKKPLRASVTTYLNVEMAATEEMLKVALDTRPDAVSLVPESANEITTEGGLDVARRFIDRVTIPAVRTVWNSADRLAMGFRRVAAI